MQNRSYIPRDFSSIKKPLSQRPAPLQDDLARSFNTVLVNSQVEGKKDFSTELRQMSESAPFKAILNSVRQLASVQGVDERQAAEQIISTFRKMDQLWNEYLVREGIEHLKKPR